jgi:hypothetical protein
LKYECRKGLSFSADHKKTRVAQSQRVRHSDLPRQEPQAYQPVRRLRPVTVGITPMRRVPLISWGTQVAQITPLVLA